LANLAVLDAYILRSVVARNNDILKKLVLEAKREYEKDAEHRVHIFMADT
jgi:mitochondrial chaperone BCS1